MIPETRIMKIIKEMGIPAIIIATVAVLTYWNTRPSDFSLTLNSPKEVISQGSTLTLSVDIKGRHYNKEVSLSAVPKYPGITVNFSPTNGSPDFKSYATITVDKSVSSNIYQLEITASGTDGQSKTCKFDLTVSPSPSDKDNSKGDLQYTAKITNLKEYERVPQDITVLGTSSGDTPKGKFMWAVVNLKGQGWWWPQSGQIIPFNREWHIGARFGNAQDQDGSFNLAIILVDQNDNDYYNYYLHNGVKTGNYPAIPLVDSAIILDKITVIRE